MGKKKKICLLSGIAVICVLFFIYLAFSLFFIKHYYFGTMLGTIDCGGKTIQEAQKLIAEKADEYVLTLQGREGMEATVSASEIDMQFFADDRLAQIAEEQNGFAWPSIFWKNREHEMPVTVRYDDALLQKRMSEMLLFQPAVMRRPADAYIGEYDSESGSYPIIAEDEGTFLDQTKAKEAIVKAIENMEDVLSLEDADCFLKPEIDSQDEKLVAFCSKINRYVTSRIVYDWNGVEEIIDGSLIHEWMEIDRENYQVTLDEEAVREYINSLSRKNDTFGRIRKFRTSEDEDIYLEPGTYGWRVDRKTETQELMKLIRSGRQTGREPEYLYTAFVKGQDDIGDSYVEIDLTDQHLWLYVDGRLITESDFVSGNLARGYDTPVGVYGLTYKTRNATLKGQGYATPVDFWMPFNGNVGMHDAKWRKEFGGTIYERNGSHGCVNLPHEAAEEIYEYVSKGFPVVCYQYEKKPEKDKNSSDEKEEEPSKKDASKEESKPSESTDNTSDAEENGTAGNAGSASNAEGSGTVENAGSAANTEESGAAGNAGNASNAEEGGTAENADNAVNAEGNGTAEDSDNAADAEAGGTPENASE